VGERLARRLFDTIVKSNPDLVIDIHNDWIRSIPYVLVDPPSNYPSKKMSRQVLKIARATQLLLVEDSDVFHPLRNTLAGATTAAGIPAFTIEAGGAFSIVENSVAAGTTAVLSILKLLGMIDWWQPPRGPTAGAQPLKYTNRPLCSSSGLIRFSVSPGEAIKKDQLLARVYSAFGSEEESLRATADGFVLGLEDHARVLPGKEVIALAELE
jgi:predicted deacylase